MIKIASFVLFLFTHAGVAKLVYAPDSKSGGLNAHVGSTPTLGTKVFLSIAEKNTSNYSAGHGIIGSTGGDIMINNFTEVIKN